MFVEKQRLFVENFIECVQYYTFMEIQQAIKNNADDLQTFVREMTIWEKEMKRKEELLLGSLDTEQTQVFRSREFQTITYCQRSYQYSIFQELPPIRNSKLSKVENEKPDEEVGIYVIYTYFWNEYQ